MRLESQNKRSENLRSYIVKYQQAMQQLYKHEIKVSAQTVGGRKQIKAEMKVQATCDAKLNHCKLTSEIERTPIYKDESNQWTWKSNIQILTPEVLSSVQELEQQSDKNKKLFCFIDTTWGSGSQQNINLRVQVFKFQLYIKF